MSMIIKGIDLPNSGEIELIIRSHGKVLSKTRGIYAEAIQIPKGARLIDANEIYIGRWDIDTDLADQIRNAPAILESEVMPK